MSNQTHSGVTTALISTGIVLVIILIGLITFGIAGELEKSRQMAGLSAPDGFDPDSLPAPAAGILKHEGGVPSGCDGIIYSEAANGTPFVRESGGGVYYAAETDGRFEIYTLSYGHLVKIEQSSLDRRTYIKLHHALYHCHGTVTRTRSGLRIVQQAAIEPQA